MRFVKSTVINRADLTCLISSVGIIAEVGVYLGDFAAELLQSFQGDLWLIDPWNSPNCEGSLVGGETHLKQVRERFKDNEQVKFARHYSQAASRLFKDEFFDMVYLDAEHTYDGVLGDIHLWWPKIKSGGILAGHDVLFYDHIGVTNALLDSNISDICFVTRGECDPSTGHLHSAASWYIVKP